MNSKVLGSTMLVAGTTIGAGMLAMPISTATVGLGVTVFQLFIFFLLLIIPALVIVELAQFAPRGTSVSGLIGLYWGKVGFTIANVLLYIFVYSLLCAYISGISSTLEVVLKEYANIDVSSYKEIFTVVCVLIFGSLVVFTNRLADMVNRVFFIIMLLTFALLVVLAIFKVSLVNISSLPISRNLVFKSLPVFFTAYGFHILVPSIYDYLDGNAKDTRTSIVGGLFIAFVLFTVWNLVIHGLVSQQELIEGTQNGTVDIGKILGDASGNGKLIGVISTIFSVCALITSFIGVAVALVTSLKESFATKESKLETPDNAKVDKLETRLGPLSLFLLAFVLPTVIILFYPQAFFFFIQAAGIIFALQTLILPIFVLAQHREAKRELYQFDSDSKRRLSTEETDIESTFNKNIYRLAIPSSILVVVAVLFFELSTLDMFVQFIGG